MKYDVKANMADLILVSAIEDMAMDMNISIEKARHKLLISKTYKDLYNFDTGLWKEGPDYLRDFYKTVK